jgi:hypothetical protein
MGITRFTRSSVIDSGEALEILDAQLRTDVEVLGEATGAMLQDPQPPTSSRRGRQPAFGADAGLLAVDERL